MQNKTDMDKGYQEIIGDLEDRLHKECYYAANPNTFYDIWVKTQPTTIMEIMSLVGPNVEDT
jgi:hypothetical protein